MTRFHLAPESTVKDQVFHLDAQWGFVANNIELIWSRFLLLLRQSIDDGVQPQRKRLPRGESIAEIFDRGIFGLSAVGDMTVVTQEDHQPIAVLVAKVLRWRQFELWRRISLSLPAGDVGGVGAVRGYLREESETVILCR